VALADGLAFVKFRYHVTFLSVVCGALLFAEAIDRGLVRQLVLLYGCFNVLLYGGIYTFNDIVDREADARHPGKRLRPVASGRVSPPAAAAFGTALTGSGLIGGWLLFDADVVACFVAALGFNACYSLGARNVRYLDLVFNSLTHPTRFLMGALLVDRIPPLTHLAVMLLLAVALSCLRREVERDVPGWQARQTIAKYAPNELTCLAAGCLMILTLMALLYSSHAPGFYAIIGCTASVVAAGGWFHRPVRAGLRAIWTQ